MIVAMRHSHLRNGRERGVSIGYRRRARPCGPVCYAAMQNDRLLACSQSLSAIVLIVIAVIYWAEPASRCPASSPATRPAPATITSSTASRPSWSACLLRLRLVPVRPEALDRRQVILADLISYPQAIVLGLLQGVSELFPISSLGHSVILPSCSAGTSTRTTSTSSPSSSRPIWRRRSCCSSSSGATGCGSSGASAARSATAGSPPTTPTPSSAGCSSSARSRPASSACRSSTRCARLRLAALGRDLPDAQRRAALRGRALAPARTRPPRPTTTRAIARTGRWRRCVRSSAPCRRSR